MNFIPGLIIPKPHERLLSTAMPLDNLPVPVWQDYKDDCLPTSDQGDTPWCAAYAGAGLVEYWNWKRRLRYGQVDPTPIRNRSKEIDGYPDEEGTTADATIRAIADLGLLKCGPLYKVQGKDLIGVKRALHRFGPCLAAFCCTDRWTSATKSGWVEGGGEQLGGHMVLLHSYDDDPGGGDPPYIGFQNSWSLEKGWRGHMRMTPPVFQAQCLEVYSLEVL